MTKREGLNKPKKKISRGAKPTSDIVEKLAEVLKQESVSQRFPRWVQDRGELEIMHRRLIKFFRSRVSSYEDAEDLVVEMLYHVAKKKITRSQADSAEDPWPYLLATARTIVSEYYLKQNSEKASVPSGHEVSEVSQRIPHRRDEHPEIWNSPVVKELLAQPVGSPVDLSGLSREEIVQLAREAKGMWKDRPEMKDSVKYVRKLREWRDIPER